MQTHSISDIAVQYPKTLVWLNTENVQYHFWHLFIKTEPKHSLSLICLMFHSCNRTWYDKYTSWDHLISIFDTLWEKKRVYGITFCRLDLWRKDQTCVVLLKNKEIKTKWMKSLPGRTLPVHEPVYVHVITCSFPNPQSSRLEPKKKLDQWQSRMFTTPFAAVTSYFIICVMLGLQKK